MKEQKELRVTRLSIKNILGIQSLEIKPGRGITVIEGENASGKTSVIEALKSVFKGGNDASLLRKGAEQGEIVLELDNGVLIERTVRETGSATMVTDPTYGQIRKPKAFLEQLIDQLGMNPVDFLTCPAKQRTQLLLEAMPIKLDNDLIEPIIGHTVDELDTDALELIDRESKRFYDDRTGVNRVAKEKRATITQMKSTLPAEDEDTDWARVVKTVENNLSDNTTELATALKGVHQEYATELASFQKRHSESTVAIQREAQDAIEKIRQKEREDLLKCDASLTDSARQISEEEQSRIQLLTRDSQPEHDRLNQRLAVARENLANQSKINQTKDYIKALSEEATLAEAQSEKDTTAIEALAKLKTSLLETLPIKGVEIRAGELFVDDIPFDRVNEARKVQIAMEIAQLRSGKLPLIIVDGLERLDSKTFEAFKKQAAKSKVQMIVTRVSDSALAVEA